MHPFSPCPTPPAPMAHALRHRWASTVRLAGLLAGLWAGAAIHPVQAQQAPAAPVAQHTLAVQAAALPASSASAAGSARPALGPDTPVLALGETQVRWDEFYFWLRHAVRHHKAARGWPEGRPIAPDHWQTALADGPLASHLLAQAQQLARQSLAMAQAAQAQGLTLSAAERAEIEAERQRNLRIYGGSEYARIVARMYGSEAVLANQSQRERLGQRLFEQRYGPNGERCTAEQVAAYVGQARLIHLKYLFVPASRPQAEAQARALRTRLLREADPGPALDAAIREHGADEAMTDAPDGRLIHRDALGPEVARAHAGLAEGQLSEVLSTPQGFYLLQRLPITPDTLVAGRSLRYWAAYNHLFKADVARWAEAVPVQRLPAFDRIDPTRLGL